MPRRLPTFARNALCLLSLLLCLGASWLWWQSKRVYTAAFYVSTRRSVTSALVRDDRLLFVAERGSPNRRPLVGVKVQRSPEAAEKDSYLVAESGKSSEGGGLGLRWKSHSYRIYTTPDGSDTIRAEDFGFADPLPAVPASFTAVSVPAAAAVAAFAVPPLVWLALHARRFQTLRRRRKLGLCRRCGYDLTGNSSGRCSECGAVVDLNRVKAMV